MVDKHVRIKELKINGYKFIKSILFEIDWGTTDFMKELIHLLLRTVANMTIMSSYGYSYFRCTLKSFGD